MERELSVCLIVATAGRTGVESVITTLALGLRDRAVELTVVTFATGALVDTLRSKGINCQVVPVRHRSDLFGLLKLRRFLSRSRCTIVHTHGARASLFAGIATYPSQSVRRIASIHELTVGSEQKPINLFLENFSYRTLFDHIVGVSDAVVQDSITRRRLNPTHLTRIYNALPVSLDKVEKLPDPSLSALVSLPPNCPVLGVVGRLDVVKGHEFLLCALPKVLVQFPDTKLLVAGSGPLRDRLTKLALSIGIGDSVKFLGETSNVASILDKLTLLIIPSLSESFGLVALEALSQGVPILATNVGGLPELVTHRLSGMLVPPRSSEALSDAIIELLCKPSLMAAFAKEGLKVADRFGRSRFLEAHLDLYRLYSRIAHPELQVCLPARYLRNHNGVDR